MDTEVLSRTDETLVIPAGPDLPVSEPAGGGPRPWIARIVLAPFEFRTWSAFAYVITDVLLAILGFCCLLIVVPMTSTVMTRLVGVVSSAIGGNPVAVAAELVGTCLTLLAMVPIFLLLILAARYVGWFEIQRARVLLGDTTQTPSKFSPRPGIRGWLQAALSDVVGWRALAYLAIKLPVAAVAISVTLTTLTAAVAAVVFPIAAMTLDGPISGVRGETYTHPLVQIAVFAAGLVLLLACAWLVRGFGAFDRIIVRWLLGPTARSERVRELEGKRDIVVHESADQLRRIERDLHDGTQARLVVVGMYAGLLKARLAADEFSPDDLAELRMLANNAHTEIKLAMSELRDVVRNIHPAILDQGLSAALNSMAGRSPLPIRVSVDLPHRLTPAAETIAYYCAAELVTNAVKHSNATEISIAVTFSDDTLTLTVGDNGHGGASIGAGTGLAGLRDRLSAVDGALSVDSPAGGPTVVTASLPGVRK